MLQHHSGWVVLPDVPGLKNVVDRFPAQGRIVLRHDSGNPWLVGRFRTDDLVPVALGPVRVALLGSCPIDATRLASIVHGLRSVADLDAVLHRLPGGVHLAASVRGEVRVQGGISGLRQVFHTRVGGVPIAGDRADLLAELAGAGIDEQALALRVAVGPTGPPLDRRTAWSGVRALPPTRTCGSPPSGPGRCGGGGRRNRTWRCAAAPAPPGRRSTPRSGPGPGAPAPTSRAGWIPPRCASSPRGTNPSSSR
ncbi:hypothetical protein [Saccharopolyspora gregorii]|uniref:hypothetical protein n=1 Tax=Saccharopolyspora gregorii TaxID=33914 RepID=UPI0021ABB72F|nr:hypothetical protein [Saccharopolyspora gregorii]